MKKTVFNIMTFFALILALSCGHDAAQNDASEKAIADSIKQAIADSVKQAITTQINSAKADEKVTEKVAKVATFKTKNSTAEVEQIEGLYVFYRSKPVMGYQYLGTYKIVLIWENNPKLLFNKLVRKTQKKYPDADGIIIDDDMGKCDVIKFKN